MKWKKINQIGIHERQKKEQQESEEERKNRKTYPEGAYVYQFFDPFKEPMVGSVFQVEYDGKTEIKTTDKDGCIYFHNVMDKESIKIDDSRFKRK